MGFYSRKGWNFRRGGEPGFLCFLGLGVMEAWGGGRMGLFLWTSSDFLGEITI